MYAVTITETLKMKVEVEAETQWEAEQIVSDRWHDSVYLLDAECFSGVEFSGEEIEKSPIDRDDRDR